MSYSPSQYTGSGIAGPYTVGFPYISQSHVEVRVGGVLKTVLTHYTWVSPTTIQFTAGNYPANPEVISISRQSNPDARLVDFQDAAGLTEATLDLADNQLFYLIQEAVYAAAASLGLSVAGVQWDALNERITNLANGVNPQDAVTMAQLALAAIAPIGTVEVANGGTGATTAPNARASLSVPSTGEVQGQTHTAFTTGGTGTVFTLTPSPALAAYAENQEFDVEFHTANGLNPTLAISGLAAKTLKARNSAGALVAVPNALLPLGWRSKVTYDGTDMVVREIPTRIPETGDVIQELTATDAGSTTASTSLVNINAGGVNFTPKSTNSKLVIEVTFSASIAALGGVNTVGTFQLYDSTGAALVGASYTIQAPSFNGGVGASAPACVRAVVANAVLTLRTFRLHAATNNAGATCGGASMVWTIREVQA